jgi:hypothetical protein
MDGRLGALADIPDDGHRARIDDASVVQLQRRPTSKHDRAGAWPSDSLSGVIFVAMGINGVIYRNRGIRLRNALHLKSISGPIDWTFHNLIPLVASVSLTSGGAGLIAGAAFGPFAIAGASVLLLLVGI